MLFTDVNMPGALDGIELSRLVHEQWPNIRLLVTSGRPLDFSVPDDGPFVAKPYDLDHVAQAVSELANGDQAN